ncbi:intermembrane space import and assembly protein 40, partial [Mesorhizobium muleiense]
QAAKPEKPKAEEQPAAEQQQAEPEQAAEPEPQKQENKACDPQTGANC